MPPYQAPIPLGGPSTSYSHASCTLGVNQASVFQVGSTTSICASANDPRVTYAIPHTVPIMTAAPSIPSSQPSLVSQLPMELRLRYLEEEQELERRHLLQRYRLLMEAPNVDQSHSTMPTIGMQSANPMDLRQPQMEARMPPAAAFPNPQSHSSPVYDRRGRMMFQNNVEPPRQPSPVLPGQQNIPMYDPRGFIPFQTTGGAQFHPSPVLPTRSNIPEHHHFFPSQATRIGNESTVLNRSQIAARQAVSKELPEFNGDPEQWPLFIATFDSTTRICGYTAEENMMRLQKCLKGKALDAVRCQLMHPRNVESVLATLKMLFGRPEIIVHALIQKIQLLPAPKAEKLNTLVDFAIAVRNMVATVQNCDLEEHLFNISLLQSLVDRLPPMIRLNWATYRQALQRVTLIEFSDWLYTLAEAASTVTIPSIQTASDKQGGVF